ncbi:MAG: family 10 glycosylhydrolase [Candidatus Aminicenantes bacterium]|nr:family 10 glycosylhydrolase [Candidatus Aminicenantes bacterium]
MRTRLIAAIAALLFPPIATHASDKQNVMIVSWGDVIMSGAPGAARLDTPEKVRESVRSWKSQGIDQVLFRGDNFRVLLFHETAPANEEHRKGLEKTRAAWESDLMETAVNAMREAGIRPYVWLTVLDEGCPPDILYADSVPFAWQSRFTRQNPQFLACDRSLTPNGRKYHWGVMEYAYPEVRQYMLEVIRAFSDRFDLDGVFLSLRTHSPPPGHADQFGFNEPVVREYKRRYGRDILREPFDLEKWRNLRGEFFTTFLREVRDHLKSRGQKLAVGVQQGEYLGPPFGNMRIQWRRWVADKVVDQLVVGHITGARARYPLRTQRTMGYLQSQEDNLGLPPIEEALSKDYGPLCARHGVDLLVFPRHFYLSFLHPTYGRGRQNPELRARLLERLEAIPEVTGIVIGYGRFLRSHAAVPAE